MSDDDGESLCCCEYYDKDKNRSHILATCCFCEDFDEGFESFITGKGFPQHRRQKFMATVQDRLRLPWRGGAKTVSIEAVIPVIVLPTIFIVAAQSLWWTVFSFSTVTVFLLYIFKFLINVTPKTKFFFVWSVTSIILLYVIFEFIVIPFLEILFEENIALSLLIGGFLFCLYTLKVRANQYHKFQTDSENLLHPGTRFHNCSICQTTVPDKDHHCVWYDCCISRQNQCLFIMSLVFAFAALLYSSNLTLTSVCHPFELYETILLPDDCSEVYQAFELGISFVSAIYSMILAVIILIILLQQILLVSIGLTRKEWNKLPFSSKCLLGVTSRKSHNRGFIRNWTRIICWTAPNYSIGLVNSGSFPEKLNLYKDFVMSNVAKVVLGSSCLFSVTVIGYVHYQQAADREKLHEGVLRDIERQQRKNENVSILQKQQQLTKQLKEASGISSEIT